MLANFLIGLREGLEAALVVSILVAYLVRLGRRDLLRYVWLGVGIAAGVSLALGAILTLGPMGLSHTATEVIGGVLSLVAVGLITWMIFWMGKTARTLRSELEHRMDEAIAVGSSAVITMALIAVGREGLETTLFLWAGITSSGSTSVPVIGAVLGLAAAVILGIAFYRGAVRLNLRVFFQWTGVFLVIIAGGICAYAVGDLQEANVLPGLGHYAWDLTPILPPTSWYGATLQGIFNVPANPTVLQVIAWVVYVVPVMILFVRMSCSRPRPSTPARPAGTPTPTQAAA